MKWRHQFQWQCELDADDHFERCSEGCCVVFAVQMTVMIEGDVMTIVWMAMMTVWYAAARQAGSHYREYRVRRPSKQTLVCTPYYAV